MLQDVEAHPNKVNWAVLVRNLLLSELSVNEIWVQQGAGPYSVFISLCKQMLTNNCVQKAEVVFFQFVWTFPIS